MERAFMKSCELEIKSEYLRSVLAEIEAKNRFFASISAKTLRKYSDLISNSQLFIKALSMLYVRQENIIS